MKRSIFLGLIIIAMMVGCSPRGSEADKSGTIYTCSMHPQIRQNHPGNCPICGMTLTPIVKESAVTPAAAGAATTVQLRPAQQAVTSVELVTAESRTLEKTIQVYGEVEYIMDQHRDFSWFYAGRVEQLLVHYNTTEVKEGQSLLEVYSAEAITDQENYLKAVRDRYLTTFYERKVAEAQVETMKARLMQAGFTEQDLEDLVQKKAVKRTLILKAPRSGTIVGSMPHIGEKIAPENVLFHIVDLDRVWFVGKVFEQDLGDLKLGQTITVETKAYPGKKFTGALVFIDRTLDEATRTVQARFELKNSKHELLPKLSGVGQIAVSLGRADVTLPTATVIDTGKRKIVYVETEVGHYEQREVNVGRTVLDRVEILHGVATGEKVVAGGAFLIDAEAQLRGGK